MQKFNARLQTLLELWREWQENDYGLEDDAWLSSLESLEKKIFSEVDEILQEFENITQFPDEIDLSQDDERLLVIFIVLLSANSGNIFDHKLTYIDYISQLLNDPKENYYNTIAKALRYCDVWVQEAVVDKMLKSINEFCIVKAVQFIGESKLTKFRSNIVAMLAEIIKQGLQKNNTHLYVALNETMLGIRAKSCIPDMERFLQNKSLRADHYEWQDTLLSLVQLNSKVAWDIYKQECEKHTLSPETLEIIGDFCPQSTVLFLLEQLEKLDENIENYIVWKEYFVIAMGFLGHTTALDAIAENIVIDDFDVVEASLNAFFMITGAQDDEDVDFEPEDCLEEDCLTPIKKWLYQNKSNFNAKKRYYGGRLFSLKNDLDTLMDSNMGSRAEASSRLANYTGEVLPFNPNGFVTHMKQSQRKWIEWFDENQDRFPDGNWYLDGNKV